MTDPETARSLLEAFRSLVTTMTPSDRSQLLAMLGTPQVVGMEDFVFLREAARFVKAKQGEVTHG